MINNYEIMIRLFVAAVLGSAIGFERERLSWAAGLRTHMLVCLGSCLMMIVSAFGFADSALDPRIVLDPSRVAAQVVSGIGFLGAGTILLRKEAIRGLTTAASLWTVAGIGLAVGGGMFIPAVFSTFLVLIILAGMKPIEKRIWVKQQASIATMTFNREEAPLSQMEIWLAEMPVQAKEVAFTTLDNKESYEVRLLLGQLNKEQVQQATEHMQRLTGLKSLRISKIKA